MLVGLHDHAADDVAGHQIGRKLNPRVAQIQNAREGPEKCRFAQTRHAFEQDMPTCDKADENTFNDGRLANDHFSNFFTYPSQLCRGAFDVGGIGAQCFCHFKSF